MEDVVVTDYFHHHLDDLGQQSSSPLSSALDLASLKLCLPRSIAEKVTESVASHVSPYPAM